jgi:hypothetical protein
LINYGIRLPTNKTNTYIQLPDDIFFIYFADEDYIINSDFIHRCASIGTIKKVHKFINDDIITLNECYSYCTSSMSNIDISVCKFFLNYISHNKKLLFMFLIELLSSNCGSNVADIIDDYLDEQLLPLLTEEEFFLLLIIYDGVHEINQISDGLCDQLTIIFPELANIQSLEEYFKTDENLCIIHKNLYKKIKKSGLCFSSQTDDDIKMIDNWILQSRILLDKFK